MLSGGQLADRELARGGPRGPANSTAHGDRLCEDRGMRIDRSSAQVTGGASGLGAATARALHERGAEVVIADLPRSRDRVDSSRFAFAPTDVCDPEQVAAAVALAAARAPLRALVNCAGIGPPGRVVRKGEPMALEHFTSVVEVNLIGTFNAIRLAAAEMGSNDPLDEGRGVILNTASIAAYEGQIGQAAYAASKGGIVGMTLPIARDLASLGIRVVTGVGYDP